MDMNKLNAMKIHTEIHHKPKTNKKHIKNNSTSKSKPKKRVERKHKEPKESEPEYKVKHYNKYFPGEYSNIRVSKDVANWLKTMQQITGDSSRSALLTRFRQIVTPVILNSKRKERKFKHDYKLIIRKEQIIAELNNKM